MNTPKDRFAQRIEDEVNFFMGQVEQERLLSEQLAQKAIAKAQDTARKHTAVSVDRVQKVVIKSSD